MQSSLMPDEPQEPKKAGPGKTKAKAKPFEVWWRKRTGWLFRSWSRFGRYRDEEDAAKVAADVERKHPGWEARVGKPEKEEKR